MEKINENYDISEKGKKMIQKFNWRPDWPDWLKGQITVPIDRILSVKNAQAWVSMDFT